MESKVILKRTVIIGIIIIALDQLLKFLALKLCADSSIEIIKDVFYINNTKNIGLAFSLNKNNMRNIFISGIIIIFIIRYLFLQKKYLNKITLTCLDMVVAGGISNLLDRIFRGGVIDFIQIGDFPIFNLADIMVVLGWILFVIYIVKIEIIKK